MATSHTQASVSTPSCPVCHKADQVKKAQAAYESGVQRLAPPAMPGRRVDLIRYFAGGGLLIGVGIFFIFILAGTGGLATFNPVVQVIQVIVTLVFIVSALVLSIVAFLRIGRVDLEAQQHYPAYDRAMENWRRLYYCARDKAVFDPQDNKVLSDTDLTSLLAIDTAQVKQGQIQSASLSHQ